MAHVIELIGAPYDLSGPMLGSRLGADAMRMKGIGYAIQSLGYKVVDSGNVLPISQWTPEAGTHAQPSVRERCYREGMQMYAALRAKVRESLQSARLPVVLGGDHSLAIGSIAGALDVYGEDLAVVWIDAHMDLNTPDTTPSGNLHGMPLAALTRLDPGPLGGQRKPWAPALTEAWSEILSQHVPRTSLGRNRVAWVGLRDVDEGEVRNFETMPGAKAWTMQDIDHLGAPTVVRELGEWLNTSGAKKLWVSFDIDALDPFFAPGTGTKVRGGLTYREGHLIAETLYSLGFGEEKSFDIVGVDLVEVNPLQDERGETAREALEWACSLFGKTIFGGPHRK